MNIIFRHSRTNTTVKINLTEEYYERLRLLLRVKKVVGRNFVRFGKSGDGGYIMVDNFGNTLWGGVLPTPSE